jgi:Holliday junction resolvase
MSQYRRGNTYEVRVKLALERDGYRVWQSRGSKSPADLIALKPGQTLLIQVKSGPTEPGVESLPGASWNALWDLAQQVDAEAIIADRDPDRQRRIRYRRITAAHQPRRQSWPCQPWRPDTLGAPTPRG